MTTNALYCYSTFEIFKELPSQQAIYVCGGVQELGCWQPSYALKLHQYQKGKWKIKACFQSVMHEDSFEFKFIIGETERAGRVIEWQDLQRNRRIDFSNANSNLHYYAVWNHYNILLCLNISHHPDLDRYFVLGNQQKLGSWRNKQEMRKMDYETSQNFKQTLTKYNPQFDDLFAHSHFFTHALTLNSSTQSFNYFYIRQGDTLQSQTHPGRTYHVHHETHKNRISVIDWGGYLVILDKSLFDQMMFQRLTNYLYLASSIKNNWQFENVLKKGISCFIHLRTKREDYLMWNMAIKAKAEVQNVELKNIVFSNVYGLPLIQEIKQLIRLVMNQLAKGHRICIHCSKKVIESPSFRLLTLTLFKKYSYNRAINEIRKRTNVSQQRYIVAHDVLAIINGWLDRHHYHTKHK